MLDFIINPIAGGKKGKKMLKNVTILQERLHERGVEYAFHYTGKKGGATKLTASLIASGATNIVAVGGDGTLHEIINGFSNFDKVALGIIPCGTGNDFANALNLPLDPKEALDIILDNTPKFTDFMQMPTIRGLNIIGMGIDVDVLKRYEKLRRKTKFGYTSSLIRTLFKFKCINFEAKFNNEHQKCFSFIAGIANGKVFGGGLPLCPLADPADGKLDFVTMDAMNKLKIINAFVQLKKGKILTLKQAHHYTTEQIEIVANAPYTVNVDGELYENIPFKVEVVHDTLRIFRV
jgi:YegS/Rv2252/BmrU family lipid kinase